MIGKPFSRRLHRALPFLAVLLVGIAIIANNKLRIGAGEWRGRLISFADAEGLSADAGPGAGNPVQLARSDPGRKNLPRPVRRQRRARFRGAVARCGHATFLDSDFASLRVIKANAEALGETPHTTILKADATRPPRATRAANLGFLDPPYGQELAAPSLVALAKAGWIAAGAVVSVELGPDDAFEAPDGFVILP